VLAADGEEFIEKLGRGNKAMTYHRITEFLKETSFVFEQVPLSQFAFHCELLLHRPAFPW
jgi:hypothetical protein